VALCPLQLAPRCLPLRCQAVTGDGYDAILSAPWYLNLGCYATDDWKKYYAGEELLG